MVIECLSGLAVGGVAGALQAERVRPCLLESWKHLYEFMTRSQIALIQGFIDCVTGQRRDPRTGEYPADDGNVGNNDTPGCLDGLRSRLPFSNSPATASASTNGYNDSIPQRNAAAAEAAELRRRNEEIRKM
jgi:hypothetical protein